MALLSKAKISVRSTRQHRSMEMLKQRMRSNGRQVCYNFARAVVKEAKARVPVDTGYLQSQIKWERVSPGVFHVFVEGERTTRSGAFYGVYVEYGTRHLAAQPFFTPAINAQKSAFKRDMKAIFRA